MQMKLTLNDVTGKKPAAETLKRLHRDESNESTHLNVVRQFEDEQMSYSLSMCKICHERRLDSILNNMDPGLVPPELEGSTVVDRITGSH